MQNFFGLCLSFIFFLLCSLTALAYSPKEGNVTGTLGSYIYRTNYSDSASGNSPYLGGLSLIANGDINDHGALEIAIFHINKLYFRTQDGHTLVEKTPLLQINLGYRYWWNSWLSSSLAFYSSYTMGEPSVVQTNFPANSGVETSAHATTMYGFDFALQQELWNRGRYSLMLDERYSRSVTGRSGESADHYGMIVGLRYFIQEKQIVDGPMPKKK